MVISSTKFPKALKLLVCIILSFDAQVQTFLSICSCLFSPCYLHCHTYTIAGTSNADFVAIENVEKQMWGLQFHPEVTHSPLGKGILKNFVVNIANAKQDWVMTDYANE
jgi:hypothetical protein